MGTEISKDKLRKRDLRLMARFQWQGNVVKVRKVWKIGEKNV